MNISATILQNRKNALLERTFEKRGISHALDNYPPYLFASPAVCASSSSWGICVGRAWLRIVMPHSWDINPSPNMTSAHTNTWHLSKHGMAGHAETVPAWSDAHCTPWVKTMALFLPPCISAHLHLEESALLRFLLLDSTPTWAWMRQGEANQANDKWNHDSFFHFLWGLFPHFEKKEGKKREKLFSLHA